MKIVQVTVSYGETQSLPEYSNVKPNLTLTAALAEGDDPTEAEQALWVWARDSVHAQIDTALESCGKAAKYSLEPRFKVLTTYRGGFDRRGAPEPPPLVVIVPNASALDKDNRFTHAGYSETQNLRLSHALRVASKYAADQGKRLIDCSDGDLSRLYALLPAEQPTPAPEPPPLSDEDEKGYQMADDEEDDRDLDDDDDE